MTEERMKLLEEHLHVLIKFVAERSTIELPEDYPLPTLVYPLPHKKNSTFGDDTNPLERRGFSPIPGYYGGVNYGYDEDTLSCVSFCRVCGGSERYYTISEEGVELVAYGERREPLDQEDTDRFNGMFVEFKDKHNEL